MKHPRQAIEAPVCFHLIGKKVICSNTEKGFDYLAILVDIDMDSKDKPYICKLEHNGKKRSFSWIVEYE